MPGSVRENDDFVRAFVQSHNINTVLDVGAGQGTYSDLLRPYVERMDGIEVWLPYFEEYDLHQKYDTLSLGDARKVLPRKAYAANQDVYDLVIFGDVLEHMTEEESLTVWDAAATIGEWGLVSVPIIHYPQGAEGGNPYEAHVQDHLTPEKVREMFGPFHYEAVYSITGTFIRKF